MLGGSRALRFLSTAAFKGSLDVVRFFNVEITGSVVLAGVTYCYHIKNSSQIAYKTNTCFSFMYYFSWL